MSAIDEILSQIPIDQLAKQLGIDEKTAEQVTRQALPALLGGMQANAQDPGGEASLAKAVQQHDGSLLDGGVDLNDVDTKDGAKIVNHVFGDNKNEVVNQLGGLAGAGGDLVKKLLPILAPIVLAWLAKKFTGGGAAAPAPAGDASATTSAAPQGGGGLGGLGDILGGLLGGSGGGGGGAGQVIDILGSLLGAGRK